MALSPFTIGLAIKENSINHNHMMMINEGNESAESFLHCLSPHQQVDQFEFTLSSPMSGGGDSKVVKKLNHNASERERRKKINTLYSILRSLFPAPDQMKKTKQSNRNFTGREIHTGATIARERTDSEKGRTVIKTS